MTTTPTKAKRTEGPCIIKECCVDKRGRKPNIWIYSADSERCIGMIHRFDEYEELPLDEEAFANAEYIRKAWNMHEELVAAMERFVNYYDGRRRSQLGSGQASQSYVEMEALLSRCQ